MSAPNLLPPVFPLLLAASSVTDLVGTDPARIYRHGSAPQNTTAPYITWFLVSGNPENTLSELPKIDRDEVQIDCWSNNDGTGANQIEALAKAVRDALEPSYYMTQIVADQRDPDTDRYRIAMTFTFWHDRG